MPDEERSYRLAARKRAAAITELMTVCSRPGVWTDLVIADPVDSFETGVGYALTPEFHVMQGHCRWQYIGYLTLSRGCACCKTVLCVPIWASGAGETFVYTVEQRCNAGSYASDYLPTWAGLAASPEAAFAGICEMHRAGEIHMPVPPQPRPVYPYPTVLTLVWKHTWQHTGGAGHCMPRLLGCRPGAEGRHSHLRQEWHGRAVGRQQCLAASPGDDHRGPGEARRAAGPGVRPHAGAALARQQLQGLAQVRADGALWHMVCLPYALTHIH